MPGALYHQGNRVLQDEFESRRLADRLEKLSRTEFSDGDKSFVESCIYFFMATADASGHPDCSFKGGTPAMTLAEPSIYVPRAGVAPVEPVERL
jgi:hypothetical protein